MPENPSAITREQVAHLGRLARLSLTEDELDHYAAQLAVILGAGRPRDRGRHPTTCPPRRTRCRWRTCSATTWPRPSLTAAEALAGAPPPRTTGSAFPRILDEE